MDSYLTPAQLGTFAGITMATNIVVQFTKGVLKKRCKDYAVRLYAFIVAFILSFIFVPHKTTARDIVLLVINSILISMASFGNYEIMADPLAKKKFTDDSN